MTSIAAWRQARDAYEAEHPPPEVLDFACPRCKAQPDAQCRRPDGGPSARFHVGRQDRWVRALMRYRRDASDAVDALLNPERKRS